MFNKSCRWLDSNPGPLVWKRPLRQLCHNHCPSIIFYKNFLIIYDHFCSSKPVRTIVTLVIPENIHLLQKGKYHCIAWPVWIQLVCLRWINNRSTGLAKSTLVKHMVSHAVVGTCPGGVSECSHTLSERPLTSKLQTVWPDLAIYWTLDNF